MRILLPVHGYGPGRAGSEDYHHSVIHGLVARGHQLTLLAPDSGDRPELPLDVCHLRVRPRVSRSFTWRFDDPLRVAHMSRAVRQIAWGSWDVVLSGLLPSLWSIQRRWPQLPSVYVPLSPIAPVEVKTYSGGDFVSRSISVGTYHLLQRWAWRHADVVVSFTPTITAYRARYFKSTPRQLIVSAPGVDAARFKPQPPEPALRHELGIPDDARVVVVFSRLIASKDIPFALRAFALPAVPHDVHLLVLGQGEARQELEQLGSRLGIAPRVHFAGFRDDVERYLALGLVYVFPSYLESFGLTLVQALATGLPSIARRSQYLRVLTTSEDIIEEGRTGYLVDTEEELAERLARLLADEMLRSGMSAAARASVLARFNWERHVDDLERALQVAVASRPTGRARLGRNAVRSA